MWLSTPATQIDDRVFQGVGIGNELFGGVAVGMKPVARRLAGRGAVRPDQSDARRGFPGEAGHPGRAAVRGAVRDRRSDAAGRGRRPRPDARQGHARRCACWPGSSGCPACTPADRDNDGVPDDVDACPDTPGVRTGDPATNGCPPPPPDRDRRRHAGQRGRLPRRRRRAQRQPGHQRLPAAARSRRRWRVRSRRRLPRRARA